MRGVPTELSVPCGTFAIATLGCKVNQYDSLAIARQLRAAGLQQVAFHQRADAYIVDTCTVTAMADRKSRKTFSRAVRKNPNAVFAVTGCAVEWAADQFRAIQPDCLIVGNRDKPQLPARLLEKLRAREVFTDCAGQDSSRSRAPAAPTVRTGNGLCEVRAALKVQDGCNRTCTYCIIPSVRGLPYSRPAKELVREARELVEEGARELVLTGVLLGEYGTNESWRRRGARHPLAELMSQLCEIGGLQRLRLSTLDPRDLHDDIIEAMATLPKCGRHVHLPLQSGSDFVLRAMKRGYTTAQFANRVERLRAAIPTMGLTTDIMVAFPGETTDDFTATLEFARAMEFSGIHVFPFSPRPGTAAESLPLRVPPAESGARAARLIQLAEALTTEFATGQLHHSTRVLIEATDDDRASGMTPELLRVELPGSAPLGAMITATPRCWDGRQFVAESQPWPNAN